MNISCADNNYYDNPNKTINFDVINVVPTCDNEEKTTNKFINKVVYDQNTEHITQNINGQEITYDTITYSALPCKVLVISKLVLQNRIPGKRSI